mgnify:CR=1 FL=1
MTTMRTFVKVLFATLLSLAFYLILTMWSGDLGLWSTVEIIVGGVLAFIAALMAKNVLFEKGSFRMLNPLRMILFLFYAIGPFFFAMARANIDVAYRVITGKINPGIVKIKPELETDLGVTLLANSITLTPGTLSVDVDEETNDLYVHWINVTDTEPEPEDVCGGFPKWSRRITQ